MSRISLRAFLLVLLAAASSLAATGGPDRFGYTWADHREADVSGFLPWFTSGPFPIALGDESISDPVDIGFSFPFYGGSYDQVVLSDNGWLSFDRAVSDPAPLPTRIPSPGAPDAVVAWLWTDLAAPTATSGHGFDGGFAIHVTTAVAGTPTAAVEAWILLYDTGVIRISWAEVAATTASAIGIESPSGDDGLEPWLLGSSADGFALEDGAILELRPPALLDCSAPTPIACGDTLRSASPTSLPRNVESYGCDSTVRAGHERVFTFSNPSLADVTVRLTPEIGHVQDLTILAGCHEQACVDGGGTVEWLPGLPAGSYSIVVDGRTPADDGSFELTVECTPQSTPTACDAPISGTTSGWSSYSWYGCTPHVLDGPEVVHEIEFDGTGNLVVDLIPEPGVELDLLVYGPDRFDPPNGCTWGDDGIALFAPPAGTYYVVVDGRTDGGTNPGEGDYTLEVACQTQLDCSRPRADLACGLTTSGTTTGATDVVTRYACSDERFDGPEVVHRFTNDATRTIGFLFDGPPDLTPMILEPGCDEGGCLKAATSGRMLVARDLAPGDYKVVIDGRAGASGAYQITPICESAMEPPTASFTLEPEQAATETLRATLSPCDLPRGDIVFAMDVTGSMGLAIDNLKRTAQAIISELDTLIDDVQFGLVSLRDYDLDLDSCGYVSGGYGLFGDEPYMLELPITSDLNALFAAMDGLGANGGGDGPEGYLRSYQEMILDGPRIGWRPGSRRVVVMIGDNEPHVCDTDACGVPRWSTGVDPGPDELAGTADDLDIATVMAALQAENITPIHLVSDPWWAELAQAWDCWTGLGGGAAYVVPDGDAPPGLVEDIRVLIEDSASICPSIDIETTPPGFETWVRNVTGPLSDVLLPALFELDVEIVPPAGTPPGRYDFRIEAVCSSAGCRVGQDVTVVVPSLSCGLLPSLAPIGPACEGWSVQLDAGGTTATGCGTALEYQFRDELGIIRAWSTDPLHGPVLPALPSSTYTVEARCPATPSCQGEETMTVDVVPEPIADAGADASVCELAAATLDAAGSFDGGCPGGLLFEWRDGATIVRPADPDPTFTPPTTTVGSTTYQVYASCAGLAGCESTDSATVTVRSCPLAVRFDTYDAVIGGGGVLVRWSTLEETGTLGFQVERGVSADGPWLAIAAEAARGAGSSYQIVDADAQKAAPWYRVVELTASGPGDATPGFRVEGMTPRGSGRTRSGSRLR